MKEFDVVIENPTGLHARPAKVFVNLAKQFKADVRVLHNGKRANAKSLISMLTLGVERGSQITVVVDGVDEEAAHMALRAAVASGLGEGEHLGSEAAAPASAAPAKSAPSETREAAAPAADGLIQGVPASPGVAVGPAYLFRQTELQIDETFGGGEAERGRLGRALAAAREQLDELRRQVANQLSAEEAAIFEVHAELLEDPELLEAVHAGIGEKQSAARSWQTTIRKRAAALRQLSDPLLAARAADLKDVGDRVLRLLTGAVDAGPRLPDHPVILFAQDLTPSDTASLDRERVLAVCTAGGGPTAHAAIIARALGLPAVVGAGPAILALADETSIVLDGTAGTVLVNPDATALAAAEAAQARWRRAQAAAHEAAAEPAITTDGRRIEVAANIGGLADARQAQAGGAEGVGLLRTEFLFLDRQEAPTEDEQVAVYRDIALAMAGQPVIVRTLDIGGDKPVPYIQVAPEENPFLGERGIRLCLARPELLRQQLRAILRAASAGPLRIMFPMVADVGEWRAARDMVQALRAELGAPVVELGIMVEVPSAALVADAFAPEVDFFSIGTNDLTQYTLAMDRMHPSLAGKSDGLHPAVLRLIARTVEAAHAAGKWVGICGELGADPQAVPILVGLGVDELSVSVPAIPLVKAQVRALSYSAVQALAQEALQCADAPAVRRLSAAATQTSD